MYFILTALAAVITTLLWHFKAKEKKYPLSTLCMIYWGATLMWLVDHVVSYLTEGGEFIEVTLSATILGLVVVIVGFLAWGMLLVLKNKKLI